ncbi:serine/threonine protein kinase [Emydomyces testavorans]|uniref:Serine/threonine protein kinase n=1 Tax=Emydomyces testavorans TaxID=2070801 RepID=A0AAF0DFS9_9EURO|nr:serine/threonine protein kinase [Emydomyces testavorans]
MVEHSACQLECNPINRGSTTHGLTSPPSLLTPTISTEDPPLNATDVSQHSTQPQPGCRADNRVGQAPALHPSKVAPSVDSVRLITTSLPDGLSTPTQRTPILSLRTNFGSKENMDPGEPPAHEVPLRPSLSSTSLPRRTSSTRGALAAPHSSAGSLSPGSVFSSPQLAALTDITPLPSPIQGNSPWRSASTHSLPRSPSTASYRGSTFSLKSLDPNRPSRSSSGQRRAYDLAATQSQEQTPPRSENVHMKVPRSGHTRNRSLSEYVPPALHASTVLKAPATGANGLGCVSPPPRRTVQNKLHRETYLAVQRGITLPHAHPPTPPSTRRGEESSGSGAAPVLLGPSLSSAQVYNVKSIRTQQPRRYRRIRQLGQGTFSQVVLAVREGLSNAEVDDASGIPVQPRLVAVKVVEYGPAGGADEERVEVSLKREVDILKSINHPSIIQLKAFGNDDKRALLVLDYCPGGDLFEFASQGPKSLSPQVIRRIFAELVAAVRYLHQNLIVHRDIKLENVLVNVPAAMMSAIVDWHRYPRAVVTLTDLGLSRRIPQPPESPLLHTRCGSEDYAAPEILMGQPYDGRSTDGWALGVLLFAIVENRLPFDPLPGTRGDPAKLRARTPHRIARCEWSWYRYGDENGEWDPAKGAALDGAQLCVQGLLKRSSRRIGLDEIARTKWVSEAINVPGGLKRGDIEVP